jgi:hypothetical protein
VGVEMRESFGVSKPSTHDVGTPSPSVKCLLGRLISFFETSGRVNNVQYMNE